MSKAEPVCKGDVWRGQAEHPGEASFYKSKGTCSSQDMVQRQPGYREAQVCCCPFSRRPSSPRSGERAHQERILSPLAS